MRIVSKRIANLILNGFEYDLQHAVYKPEDETSEKPYIKFIRGFIYDKNENKILKWVKRYDEFYILCTRNNLSDEEIVDIHFITVKDVIKAYQEEDKMNEIKLVYASITYLKFIDIFINRSPHNNSYIIKIKHDTNGVTECNTRKMLLEPLINISRVYTSIDLVKEIIVPNEDDCNYEKSFKICIDKESIGTIKNFEEPLTVTYKGKFIIPNPEAIEFENNEIDVNIDFLTKVIYHSDDSYFHILTSKYIYSTIQNYINNLFSNNDSIESYFAVNMKQLPDGLKITITQKGGNKIPHDEQLEFIPITVTEDFVLGLNLRVEPIND
jgi:hypothetical protein